MKYTQNKSCFLVDLIETTSNGQIIHRLIGLSKADLRKHIKKIMKEILSKGNKLSWNEGTKHEVQMFRSENYYDHHDEFIESVMMTQVGEGADKTYLEHNKKTKLNPNYAGRPTCEFCHTRVTKVYSDHLINTEKTKINVCAKCKKQLSTMRQIRKVQIEKTMRVLN